MDGIEGAITEITQMIFDNVLGLPVEESGQAAVSGPHQRTISGRVQITGAFEGSVALYCSDTLARKAAAILFDVDLSQATNEQAHEVVAELANMTGGNLKALMAQPSQLSLPAVCEGTNFADSVPGSHLIGAVSLACLGEPVVVSIVERNSR